MIHLTKQFGKYTINLWEGEQYTTDPTIGMYEHTFEVALTGTYERVMYETVTKNKRIDIFKFYEGYYDFIQQKHLHLLGMGQDDWTKMITELGDELKAERRRILSGKLKPSEIWG